MAKVKNVDELKKLIRDGTVTFSCHPDGDLYIFNYSREASRNVESDVCPWNNETICQCRGLITDFDFNIVARPFEKFFNVEELKELPEDLVPEGTFKLPYTITEKLDGSLGILYWTKDGPALATRSTFTSEQALRGTKILREKYGDVVEKLPRNKTFLFEIIYPENRLVVDYGDTEDLYLLAVIDTETGEEDFVTMYPQFKHPQIFTGDWHDIRSRYTALGKDKNREGFVVRFENGFRVKLKFENYFKLHYYTGKLSKRYLVKMLSGGEKTRAELEEIRKQLAGTDGEFVAHINSLIQEIYDLKNWYLEEGKKRLKMQDEFPSVQEWAKYVRSNGRFAPVIFKLYWLANPRENFVTDAMGRRAEHALDDVLWKLVATHDGFEFEENDDDDC